jgi:hypothetical protein
MTRGIATLVLSSAVLVAGIAVAQTQPAKENPGELDDPYGILRKPIPENTVVLTFDDSVASHATVVAPILKQLGFGGSFLICDFDSFNTRKDWYMVQVHFPCLFGHCGRPHARRRSR